MRDGSAPVAKPLRFAAAVVQEPLRGGWAEGACTPPVTGRAGWSCALSRGLARDQQVTRAFVGQPRAHRPGQHALGKIALSGADHDQVGMYPLCCLDHARGEVADRLEQRRVVVVALKLFTRLVKRVMSLMFDDR